MKRKITDYEILLLIIVALLLGVSIKFVLRSDRQGAELVNIESGQEEREEKAFLEGLSIGKGWKGIPFYIENDNMPARYRSLDSLAYSLWKDTTMYAGEKSAKMFNIGRALWLK